MWMCQSCVAHGLAFKTCARVLPLWPSPGRGASVILVCRLGARGTFTASRLLTTDGDCCSCYCLVWLGQFLWKPTHRKAICTAVEETEVARALDNDETLFSFYFSHTTNTERWYSGCNPATSSSVAADFQRFHVFIPRMPTGGHAPVTNQCGRMNWNVLVF